MPEHRARGRNTREHLIERATELFVENGYDAVSIEMVLLQAGLSRGALYHHFDGGKEALFAAVLDRIEARVVEAVATAAQSARSAREALRVGSAAWLRLAVDDAAVRRIVLRDAPAVLGWERWREIDGRFAFGLIKQTFARAVAEGELPADDVELSAHLLLAMLIESALIVAKTEGAVAPLTEAQRAIEKVIDGLLSGHDVVRPDRQ